MKDSRPNEPTDSRDKFEKALEDANKAKYVLRLYVAGNTSKSAAAIENLREICETSLKGRYTLEVIDIYQQPELARSDQILAAPTLVKSLPLPLRHIIGDLSDAQRILVGLNLIPAATLDGKEESREKDQEESDE